MCIFIAACQRVFKDMATEVKMKEAVGDWLNQAKVRKIRRLLFIYYFQYIFYLLYCEF